MEYDNKNRGSLWENERRPTDRHPHYTGELDVDGTKYWVSCWKKNSEASDKAPVLTFSIKLKEDSQFTVVKDTEKDIKKEEQEEDGDMPF